MLRVAEHWSGTDTGLQRRANEDSLLVRSPLFIVADGMGGAQAGEVASRVAVETFRAGLLDGGDPEGSLERQVREANARINELSHQRAEHAGMGTTITAVYVGEQEVSVAHVGDSRAYCIRDGGLQRLTDDHSLVDELIRQGRLTPEEAEGHPQRSVITRALGPEATVEVDVRSIRGRAGDLFLLCSDGLTSMVGEDELRELIASHSYDRLRDAGEALIAAANAAGGKDNITVILLRLEEVAAAGDGRAGHVHATMTDLSDQQAPSQVADELAADELALTQVDGELAPAQIAAEYPPARVAAEYPPARVASELGSLQPSDAVTPRVPRRPEPAPADSLMRRMRRRARRARGAMVALVVLGALGAGGYLALQSVYFIGTNQRGLVTIFRGLPYELPGGIKLYSSDYVSGVSASRIPPQHRQALLDHTWRSEGKAAELVRQLELGQLSEGS